MHHRARCSTRQWGEHNAILVLPWRGPAARYYGGVELVRRSRRSMKQRDGNEDVFEACAVTVGSCQYWAIGHVKFELVGLNSPLNAAAAAVTRAWARAGMTPGMTPTSRSRCAAATSERVGTPDPDSLNHGVGLSLRLTKHRRVDWYTIRQPLSKS